MQSAAVNGVYERIGEVDVAKPCLRSRPTNRWAVESPPLPLFPPVISGKSSSTHFPTDLKEVLSHTSSLA